MVKIFSRLITKINRTIRQNKTNDWVLIHYVGAVSSAANNAKYFNTSYRGASAHYFVDENSIWQVVEEKDNAWHVGGAKTYYTGARNSNSIGIEMCCKNNGQWYIEPETIDNTAWLAATILKRYKLPISRLTTHYLTTHKKCPEPFVREPKLWEEFKRKVANYMEEELTINQKEEVIRKAFSLDENTTKYFEYYRYGTALIDKLYYWAKQIIEK